MPESLQCVTIQIPGVGSVRLVLDVHCATIGEMKGLLLQEKGVPLRPNSMEYFTFKFGGKLTDNYRRVAEYVHVYDNTFTLVPLLKGGGKRGRTSTEAVTVLETDEPIVKHILSAFANPWTMQDWERALMDEAITAEILDQMVQCVSGGNNEYKATRLLECIPQVKQVKARIANRVLQVANRVLQLANRGFRASL